MPEKSQASRECWTRANTKYRSHFCCVKGLQLLIASKSIWSNWHILIKFMSFFSSSLSRGLPSSFKGQHGFICYYVNASIVDDQEVEPLLKTKSVNVAVQSGIRKPDLLVGIDFFFALFPTFSIANLITRVHFLQISVAACWLRHTQRGRLLVFRQGCCAHVLQYSAKRLRAR